MASRYTDFAGNVSGAGDFVIRKRVPTMPQLILILLSTLLIILSISLAMVDKSAMAVILFVAVSFAGWYAIIQVQRHRDMLLATEFQNALFASALGLNHKFCVIIRRDGNIVYLDRSFQDMFPDFLRQPQRSIESLLQLGKVSDEDTRQVSEAIGQGVYEKVVFDIHGARGESYRIIMSIEPIMRPAGFILLRGREFIEKRSGKSAPSPAGHSLPNLLSKPTITLFSHVMDSMNMGLYMTGPKGNIIYANPVLEQWLDFQEGELTSGNLTLKEIIHQPGERSDATKLMEKEGEIMLQKKTGGLMKAYINQTIIRDEDKKIIGCTALVHHFIDQNRDEKKKVW